MSTATIKHVFFANMSLQLAVPNYACCSACQSLIQRQLEPFLLQYPHPAVDFRILMKFKSAVESRALDYEYNLKTLKLNHRCHYCVNMAVKPPKLRPGIVRFALLWKNPRVQWKIHHNWFTSVRKIDTVLFEQANKLKPIKQYDDSIADSIFDAISQAVIQRSELSVILRAAWKLDNDVSFRMVYASAIAKAMEPLQRARRPGVNQVKFVDVQRLIRVITKDSLFNLQWQTLSVLSPKPSLVLPQQVPDLFVSDGITGETPLPLHTEMAQPYAQRSTTATTYNTCFQYPPAFMHTPQFPPRGLDGSPKQLPLALPAPLPQ